MKNNNSIAVVICLSFILLYITNSTVIARENLKIYFNTSKTYSILYFLESLRGEFAHSTQFKKIIDDQLDKSKLDEFEKKIKEYNELMNCDYAVYNKKSKDLLYNMEDILEVLAASSNTTDDFIKNSRAIFKNEDSKKFKDLFNYFEPVYTSLIWEQTQGFLMEKVKRAETTISKIDLPEKLETLAVLYESKYPTTQGFEIILMPIPNNSKERVRAWGHTGRYFEMLEITPEFKTSEILGVASHECCHTLWAYMSGERERQLKRWFLEVNGVFQWQLLDEALATAFGNGFIGNLISKDNDLEVWYRNIYIDKYAKAILPLLEKYISMSKPLDKNFCIDAMNIFNKIFSNARKDPRLILRATYNYSNDKDVLKTEFCEEFLKETDGYCFIDNPKKFDDMTLKKISSFCKAF